jgi:hypothetical protein
MIPTNQNVHSVIVHLVYDIGFVVYSMAQNPGKIIDCQIYLISAAKANKMAISTSNSRRSDNS